MAEQFNVNIVLIIAASCDGNNDAHDESDDEADYIHVEVADVKDAIDAPVRRQRQEEEIEDE